MGLSFNKNYSFVWVLYKIKVAMDQYGPIYNFDYHIQIVHWVSEVKNAGAWSQTSPFHNTFDLMHCIKIQNNRLTPRATLLLAKLVIHQIVKKFPVICRTRNLTDLLTTACHRHVSCVRRNRPKSSYNFKIRFNIITFKPTSYTSYPPLRLPTRTLH
jgi:hypothetical protein